MGKRDKQKEERREQIIFEALDLFLLKGYAATRVSDIAKAASMSMGLLFHYFDSKESLYTEILKVGLQVTMQPASQNCLDAIVYFEQLTRSLFDAMRKYPYVAKMFVLMEEARQSEGIPETAKEVVLKMDSVNKFIPLIWQGQKEGTIREGDAKVLASAYWYSMLGIVAQYAKNPNLDLPKPEWIISIIRKPAVIV